MLHRLNLDRWSWIFFILAAVLSAIQAGLLLWAQGRLPPQVPLFYSLPWGESRLADPIWLWLLPGLSGVVLLVNLVGSHLASATISARILGSTAFVFAVLSAVTIVKIIILEQP